MELGPELVSDPGFGKPGEWTLEGSIASPPIEWPAGQAHIFAMGEDARHTLGMDCRCNPLKDEYGNIVHRPLSA